MSFLTNASRKKNNFKGILGASLLLGLASSSLADTQTVRMTALVPVGPDPTLAGNAQPQTEPIIEEMEFLNIKVAELLGILAKQFRVKVIVNSDVAEVKLASISLVSMTPTSAVEYIVEAANLQFKKKADGTYIIAKEFTDGGGHRFQEATTTAMPGQVGPLQVGGTALGQGGAAILPNNMSQVPLVNFGGVGGLSPLRESDPIELIETRTTSKVSRVRVRTRNLSPSILAYWLDPENNEEPIQFRRARQLNQVYSDKRHAKNALSFEDQAANNGNQPTVAMPAFSPGAVNPYLANRSNSLMRPQIQSNAQFGRAGGAGGGARGGAARGGAGGGIFQLPTGVTRIVAIDPQNALLVEFTDVAGLQELQDTIAFLDRPLRQVEIEAQFVTVSTGDSRSFGIDFSTSRGNFNVNNAGFAPQVSSSAPGLTVGFVKGNFQAQINSLVNKNRAKVITAPRVTAINNLTASLQSTTSSPLILSSSSSGIGGQVGQSQNLIYITTTIGLTVTPTINNDDTVTVLMQPQFSSQNPSGVPGVAAPAISQQTLDTIANVRDGETIALGGLKTRNTSRGQSKIPLIGDLPLIGSLFRTRGATDQDSELIIFLTARILRRFGDDDVNPAGT